MLRHVLLCFTSLFATSVFSLAQVNLESGLLFVDKTNAKTQLWQVNGSASENQGFLFPSASGTVGQVVKVSNVSSGSTTFSWSTPTGSLSGLSSISTTNTSDGSAWALGPGIAVTANQAYRIIGEFAIYRGADATENDDAIHVSLRDMPASTYAEYSFECSDCPAGTTDVPSYVSGTGSNVQMTTAGTAVDPGGSTDYCGPANTFHYRLEGVVRPVSNGTVYFGFNKQGGSATTWLVAGSYWAVIAIE